MKIENKNEIHLKIIYETLSRCANYLAKAMYIILEYGIASYTL